MKFHNEDIYLGDRVYDVSVSRGYGVVISVDDNMFQVKFDSFSVNYTAEGVQQGKSETTLFWSVPLIIKPKKKATMTRKKAELVEKFFDLVKDYAEYL